MSRKLPNIVTDSISELITLSDPSHDNTIDTLEIYKIVHIWHKVMRYCTATGTGLKLEWL